MGRDDWRGARWGWTEFVAPSPPNYDDEPTPFSVFIEDDVTLAYINWEEIGEERAGKVAALMSAAPDMLTTLEASGVLSCTPEWEARRRAAIAKARDEAP